MAFYTDGKYVSDDLDFVNRYGVRRSTIISGMGELGFREVGRHFEHPDSKFPVEFPPGPLAIGESHTIEVDELELETGRLVLITPTESVKDRLAWYYHTGDRQSLQQAILVARDQTIDLDEIMRWSDREGKPEQFQEFRQALQL